MPKTSYLHTSNFSLLVHEAEEGVQIHLVVLAAGDHSVHDRLQVVEDGLVGNVFHGHCLSLVGAHYLFARVLLDILRHVEETLQIPQRVISLTLIDDTVQLALARSICASLVD